MDVVLFVQWRNALPTCRHLGISRQTFYRWKRRFDRHDLTTLEERSHRPRQVRQPTWTVALAEDLLALRQQYPALGQRQVDGAPAKKALHGSTLMVGRILAHLKRRGVLRELPQAAVLRQARRKLARSHRAAALSPNLRRTYSLLW